MVRHQSKAQKETVGRVMHEFKHGDLKRGRAGRVSNPKQAIAIALHEAGASKYEANKKNRETLQRTKSRERRGRTAQAEAKGEPRSRRQSSPSRAELYAEARRRDIAGRSKMTKEQLQQALRRA